MESMPLKRIGRRPLCSTPCRLRLPTAARVLLWSFLLLCLTDGALARAAQTVQAFQGQVVGITDGDTVTVLDSQGSRRKIRLAGIDAPERHQAFGSRSKQSLSALIFGRTVAVEWTNYDRYQRVLGKIVLGGKDINLEQIRSGMAWWYEKYAHEQSREDQILYREAQITAKGSQSGLWGIRSPVAPWDFRRQRQ